MEFVIHDNKTKKHKKDREGVKIAERTTREDTVKKLDQQIMAVQSEIEKNRASLNEAERYKEFLLTIDPDFAMRMAHEKSERKNEQKSAWIKKMKNVAPSDPMYKIIFTDDEMIHDDVKLQLSVKAQTTNKDAPQRGVIRPGRSVVANSNLAQQMTQKDW